MSQNPVTLETAVALGLHRNEYIAMVDALGRGPNLLEINVLEKIWLRKGVHAGYMELHSGLPTGGANIVEILGERMVGIGNDLACRLEMFSTGITNGHSSVTNLAMDHIRSAIDQGHTPIATLNSLIIGGIDGEESRTRLQNTIGQLGNDCKNIGVPIVGGETQFYLPTSNPSSIGILSASIVSSDAHVAATGCQAGLSICLISTANHPSESTQYSSSQAFNRLLNILDELNRSLHLVAIKTIDSAGAVSTAWHIAGNKSVGLELNLDKFPQSDGGNSPHDLLFKPNGYLAIGVIQSGSEEELNTLAMRQDLKCTIIGQTLSALEIAISHKGTRIAQLPAGVMPSIPRANTNAGATNGLPTKNEGHNFDILSVPEPDNLRATALTMIQLPNIASKHWVTDQFDATVGNTNLTIDFPSSAAVVRLNECPNALALSIDSNPNFQESNPETGAMITTAESLRNIICTGAKPLAVAIDVLMPHQPTAADLGIIERLVTGAKNASNAFGIPIAKVHVSSPDLAQGQTPPTLRVGAIGLLNPKNHLTIAFKEKGHMIYLIGVSRNDISSSQYLQYIHATSNSGCPHFDPSQERLIQTTLPELISRKLIKSANDVSQGGLFATLLECGVPGCMGFDITSDAEIRTDAFLFGESQGRVVVTVSLSNETAFIDFMMETGLPFTALGHVTKSEIRIDDVSFGYMTDIRRVYGDALTRLLSQ